MKGSEWRTIINLTDVLFLLTIHKNKGLTFFKMLTRIAWRYAKKDKKLLPVDDIFEKADEKSVDTSIEEYLRKEQNTNVVRIIL